MVLCTLYREIIPFITREFVVSPILLGNFDRAEKDLLFSASHAASNSHKGEIKLHREYYIFIHTVIKSFVYGFTFSLDSHVVRLCYIVPSSCFFVHAK